MRPDRLIVGEVRQQEALDLLVALNSGLPGMTSIHANSAREALTKLTTLPLLAGENVTHAFVVPTVATSIDLIVHLSNDRGKRRTAQILGVTGRVEGDRIETVSLWERSGDALVWTGQQPPADTKFRRAGIEAADLMS
jgi:pilus assembly protein CpaF